MEFRVRRKPDPGRVFPKGHGQVCSEKVMPIQQQRYVLYIRFDDALLH